MHRQRVHVAANQQHRPIAFREPGKKSPSLAEPKGMAKRVAGVVPEKLGAARGVNFVVVLPRVLRLHQRVKAASAMTAIG